MKRILRPIAASLIGIMIGWKIRLSRGNAAPPPQTVLTTPADSPAHGKEKQEAWRTWLDAGIPLPLMADPEAVWAHLPKPGSCTAIEWNLALDEIYFSISDEAFLSFLTDARFAALPRAYESKQNSPWHRKLLGLGLEEALGMAGRLPTQALNLQLEHKFLQLLARQDPERGFDRMRESGHEDPNQMADYLKAVARQNPDKLSGLFAKIVPGHDREWYSGQILAELATRDWRQAEEWGKQNLTAEEWKKAAGDIFDGYSGGRLAELKKIGDAATDPTLRSAAYSRWVFWPVADCGETLGRALALPAGSLDEEGWKRVAVTCSYNNRRSGDPDAGAAELRQLFSRVPEASRAVFQESLLQSLAWNDGPMGAKFYDELSAGNVAELSRNWTRKDPAAVSAWLATLPASDKKEAAVVKFCQEAASADPAGAAAWALTIIDPDQRETTLGSALAAWKQADPAGAAAWAEAHGKIGGG